MPFPERSRGALPRDLGGDAEGDGAAGADRRGARAVEDGRRPGEVVLFNFSPVY